LVCEHCGRELKKVKLYVVNCAGLMVKLARCFSMVKNIELLLMRPVTSLPYIDGLRVMSFALLIFGQTARAMFQSNNIGLSFCIVVLLSHFIAFYCQMRDFVSFYQ